MKVSNAIKLYLEYHKSHSKENSVRAYMLVLSKFCEEFGSEDLEDITNERILSFLNCITEGKKPTNQKNSLFPSVWLFSTLLKIIWIRISKIPATPRC